ncbi:hypothetical protein OPV22_008650 [Ensete ventricosum]|uniref:Uncharacterized protein n=1 Tax=Ensete ventricosum TaxID=4639 RepID=A0AAV8R3F7_ENSVE|nr:hypothetical protein OPV22_008650 [Ensete ventricosum]
MGAEEGLTEETFVVLSSCSRRSRARLAISSRESHASVLSIGSSREFHASILSVVSSDLCGKGWWMFPREKAGARGGLSIDGGGFVRLKEDSVLMTCHESSLLELPVIPVKILIFGGFTLTSKDGFHTYGKRSTFQAKMKRTLSPNLQLAGQVQYMTDFNTISGRDLPVPEHVDAQARSTRIKNAVFRWKKQAFRRDIL